MIKYYCNCCKHALGGRRASSLETTLISLTLFCLPLFEAPKNVFGILFLAAHLIHSLSSRSFGRSSLFDWPIIALAGVLWVSPYFSELDSGITALNSAPRWTLLALFVVAAVRLDYSSKQVMIIWCALISGGVSAVFDSFVVWQQTGGVYPELRSVGHVNHSAMYTQIVLASGIGAMSMPSKWVRTLGVLAMISTLAFFPPSRSIVSGITIFTLFLLGMYLIYFRHYSLKGLFFALSVILAASCAFMLTPQTAGIRVEIVDRLTGDNPFSGRDRILNSALAVWDRHPIIGSGWFSFGDATSRSNVEAALAVKGLEFSSNIYWNKPHGHNLWVTMLIERGLLGVFLVSILLVLYLRVFVPIGVSKDRGDLMGYGVALTALLVTVAFAVGGLGNTTMMNEHGHAGMAMISVAYGYLRGRGLLPYKSE